MPSSFWKTQPAETGEETGMISKPVNIPRERLALPEGLRWEKATDISTICFFLRKYYVEDSDSMYRLSYSEVFFEYLFAAPNHNDSFSLSIVDSDGMAGYVLAKVHHVVVKGVEQDVVSINFMCLSKKYRRINLAPILIGEITRVVNACGIFQAIFTGKKDYGFSISEAIYHHVVLDPFRLSHLGYISTLGCADRKYTMREDTSLATADDMKAIHELYNREISKYSFDEKFTLGEFQYIFKNREGVMHTLCNHNRREYASFFIVDTFCIDKGETFGTAYLYYWSGTPQMIADTICYARSLGLALFNMLDLGNNKEAIEEHGMMEGTGVLKYHLFNWREKFVPKEKLNLIFF